MSDYPAAAKPLADLTAAAALLRRDRLGRLRL